MPRWAGYDIASGLCGLDLDTPSGLTTCCASLLKTIKVPRCKNTKLSRPVFEVSSFWLNMIFFVVSRGSSYIASRSHSPTPFLAEDESRSSPQHPSLNRVLKEKAADLEEFVIYIFYIIFSSYN